RSEALTHPPTNRPTKRSAHRRTHTHTHTHKIQFNLIYMAPKQYNCLKALYRVQGLNPLRESTIPTGARKKLPVNQEGTLSRTMAHKGGPIFLRLASPRQSL